MLRNLLAMSLLSLGLFHSEIKADGTIQSQVLLSPEKEIELALKAGPAHLRSAATVYVFSKRGYEKPGPARTASIAWSIATAHKMDRRASIQPAGILRAAERSCL